MPLDQTLLQLRAIAEPTRYRLLALLAAGEISVGELSAVLGQSQPRVSRHLRLLVEAGLVSRFRDRHWIYYRLAADTQLRELVDRVLRLVAADDATLEADRAEMERVRREREGAAYTSLGSSPALWPGADQARISDAVLSDALDDALGGRSLGDLLDIGSGSGTLLRLLAPRAASAVGVDRAKEMRLLSRSRLQRAGLADCTVRDADIHALPFDANSFDTVVMDEVMSGNAEPQRAIGEALRVLRPDGCLLILDRFEPVTRRLTQESPQDVIIENHLQVMLQQQGFSIVHRSWFPGRALNRALFAAVRRERAHRTGTDD